MLRTISDILIIAGCTIGVVFGILVLFIPLKMVLDDPKEDISKLRKDIADLHQECIKINDKDEQ